MQMYKHNQPVRPGESAPKEGSPPTIQRFYDLNEVAPVLFKAAQLPEVGVCQNDDVEPIQRAIMA